MIYIVCDMNCNNLGNYFSVVGVERLLKSDKSSWIMDNSFYPKRHCYRARINKELADIVTFRYGEAINCLLPEDYVRWHKKRFKGS